MRKRERVRAFHLREGTSVPDTAGYTSTNGIPFKVRPALFQALRRVRRRREYMEKGYVSWVTDKVGGGRAGDKTENLISF